MLKHTETESEPISAAKVRVTPQELADAIATLQAHQDGMAETIAIGDAVQELSLAETPEEVLRVVQERREQKQRERAGASRKKKRTRRLVLAAAILAVFPVVHTLRSLGHTQAIKPPVTAATQPEIMPVSAVPDGQYFYADAQALAQIFQKAPLSQIRVHRTEADLSWSMIKHGGKVYLAADTPPISESQLKQKHIVLYSGPPEGALMDEGNGQLNYIQATFPIENVHLEDSQMGEKAEKIVISNIQTDSHLWEAN